MAKHILFCSRCKKYTLNSSCPECNSKTVLPKPPKYSPEDKYGKFRREVKGDEYKEKNLI
jgi:H/ACA ribonucleoprotein complex subunit 3